MSKRLSLEVLPDLLAVARLEPKTPIPDWAMRSSFFSISKTTDELSIVCRLSDIPTGIKCEPHWRALKVKGPLDFGLTGVLASLTQPLLVAGVSIFAISTFDTDYVLVKQEYLDKAMIALEAVGHTVRRSLCVRPERSNDIAAIQLVHDQAFKSSGEGRLVNLIRTTEDFVAELSIVAEDNGVIVGHVLFSKVKLVADGRARKCLSLAPIAVLPEMQRQRIGSRLIEEGIRSAQRLGFESILVLGDPKYYGRFGFERRLASKISSPYSGEHYAGLELVSGALQNFEDATVEYPPAFSVV